MSRELMKLALKELQNARDHIYLLPENEQPLTEEQILNRINAAITVLHQEVYRVVNDTSQKCVEKQESVAWISEGGDVSRSKRYMDEMGFKCNPLYTAPSKQWVGLTDEEHDSIKHNYHNMTWTLEMFARAIEQALKEKNHG